MQILLVLLIALFMSVDSRAATTWTCGTNGVNNSCTVAGITSLIAGASAGDTIQIASGTHSWTSAPIINKGLTIKGSTSCTRDASTYEVNCTDGTTINSTSSFFYIQANNIKITNLTLIGDGGDIAFPFEPGIQLNLLVEGNKIQNVYKMITKTGSCALKNMVYARNRIIDCTVGI
jgi:hypothetical protein